MSAKVAVAMSGGVDSSVAVYLMLEQGFEVIGITLDLFGKDISHIKDAQKVAKHFGIYHETLECHSSFKKHVIDYFVNSYLDGLTPLPCAKCNDKIKFGVLLGHAKELGCDFLATGHYIRRLDDGLLYRALDLTRDQSYFLFALSKAQIAHTIFPLGGLTKVDVRRIAAEQKIPVAKKPDSQDICFIKNCKYSQFVEDNMGQESSKPGRIVDMNGNILGQHKGLIYYTIGQRRNIGISAAHALYVVRIDREKNEVVVGPKEALVQKTIYVEHINWMCPLENDDDLEIKIRSNQNSFKAHLIALNGNNATVEILNYDIAGGIAPGQACVFYRNDLLLGGGWLTS